MNTRIDKELMTKIVHILFFKSSITILTEEELMKVGLWNWDKHKPIYLSNSELVNGKLKNIFVEALTNAYNMGKV